MKTSDVVAYFGSHAAVARVLGVDPSAVFHWGKAPPVARQYQIQVASHGRLRVCAAEKRRMQQEIEELGKMRATA